MTTNIVENNKKNYLLVLLFLTISDNMYAWNGRGREEYSGGGGSSFGYFFLIIIRFIVYAIWGKKIKN